MTASPLAQTPNDIFNAPIAEADPEIAEVLNAELSRQQNGLEMIASENFVSRAVPPAHRPMQPSTRRSSSRATPCSASHSTMADT